MRNITESTNLLGISEVKFIDFEDKSRTIQTGSNAFNRAIILKQYYNMLYNITQSLALNRINAYKHNYNHTTTYKKIEAENVINFLPLFWERSKKLSLTDFIEWYKMKFLSHLRTAEPSNESRYYRNYHKLLNNIELSFVDIINFINF